MKATRPRKFFSIADSLQSEVLARISDRALNGSGRNGRRVAEVDLGIRAAHAAAHIERASRDGALVGRHGGDAAKTIVTARRGDESSRFREDRYQPLPACGGHDLLAGRHNVELKAGFHLPALQHLGCYTQILQATG